MESEKREDAKRLLLHYLTNASEGRSLSDIDSRIEVGEIVDYIVDAAVAEVRAELAKALA